MSIEYNMLRWIILFPLISFLINFLFSRFLKERISSIIACGGVLLSFIFSLISFLKLVKMPYEISIYDKLFTWINISELSLDVKFVMDPLSSIMAMVVSGVSFLIHIYSIGYMHNDRDFKRFFSYLNLFVFFMLILVLSDNLLLMFVGWEGVGLSSYLLIGFWYENINNSIAAKKAFITNRIGDAFFIIGILVSYFILSSNGIFNLSFSTINSNADLFLNTKIYGISSLTLITFLFFIGATGKSAQFPLYVWLPDAMAGPTPVSALIHAATMVTAGVYLIARLNPLYSLSVNVSNLILYTAGFTAFFSALIAITQKDIKKILAYSTISQLGYMFMGVSIHPYAGGIFHLMTHAFFKALLFLTAGAVIHSLNGEQDIFKMGGLKDKLKAVFIVMLIGWMSITGFPFLSGYFSKDFIIENLYLNNHYKLWLLSNITAFLTAIYMTRLFKLAFIKKQEHHHIHEPPSIMMIPLYILAILSISAGYFLKEFLSFLNVEHSLLKEIPFSVKYAPTIFAITGIIAGFYLTEENVSSYLVKKFKIFYDLSFNKFYVDEIYEFLIIKPLYLLAEYTFKIVDRIIIDKTMVEGTAYTFYNTSKISLKMENGNIRTYLTYILSALIIMIIVLLKRSI